MCGDTLPCVSGNVLILWTLGATMADTRQYRFLPSNPAKPLLNKDLERIAKVKEWTKPKQRYFPPERNAPDSAGTLTAIPYKGQGLEPIGMAQWFYQYVQGARGLRKDYLEPIPPRIDCRIWRTERQVVVALSQNRLHGSMALQCLREAKRYAMAYAQWVAMQDRFAGAGESKPKPAVASEFETAMHARAVRSRARRARYGDTGKRLGGLRA